MWVHLSLPLGRLSLLRPPGWKGKLLFLNKRHSGTWNVTQPFLPNRLVSRWAHAPAQPTKATTTASTGTDSYDQLESFVLSNQLKPSLGFLL